MTHTALNAVTARIIERSKATRSAYLERMERASKVQKKRGNLGCANLAHGFAACGPDDKAVIRAGEAPNIGIVTAFNDMLSAHQPMSASQISSRRQRARQAAQRRWRVAFRPCAMASHRARRVWNFRYSRAM